MDENKDGEHLGWLFGMVFGVSRGASAPEVPAQSVEMVAQAVDDALATLTPREERVLRMRLGLNREQRWFSQQTVANHFNLSRYFIKKIEAKALRKLRHPSRSRHLKQFLDTEYNALSWVAQRSSTGRLVELIPVIATVKETRAFLNRSPQTPHRRPRQSSAACLRTFGR
jgi:DNA-binding CsgD family transcriptional regulator